MTYTIQEFHDQLIQGVITSAESMSKLRAETFLDEVLAYLVDDADLTENVEFAEYRNINLGIEVHGYDFDEERGILSLIINEFSQEDEIKTINKVTIETKFKRVKNFFKRAQKGLYAELEDSSPACEMAYYIYSNINKINTVKYYLITDCKMATRVDIKFEHQQNEEFFIIDIDYLYKIFLSKNSNKEYSINIEEILGKPLPCLKANVDSTTYDSYLLVVPGKLIYEMYQLYGQKLLEQNVRTFLQFKGKVNKGLRLTLHKEPEMFFAYNNGLTATATSIDFTNNNEIKSIKGLQIVNGGQTTSAIYATCKHDKTELEHVFVQMKLSIIKNENFHDNFVSKISEYANTQNKVSKSDFFSNSPFHKEFKDHSERIYAPQKVGTFHKTKWFYERARGQYLQSIALLTKANQNMFKKENPKEQVIEKPMLAKSELSWLMKPDIVAKGAETCFAQFANLVTESIEKDEHCITEYYFKSAVAKIILFKALEKIISTSSWYNGGYRAQCVTYTISLLSYLYFINKKNFDFIAIWNKQDLNKNLRNFIAILAKDVYSIITVPVEGDVNISQYCKKIACWNKVRELAKKYNNLDILEQFATNKEEIRILKKNAKDIQEIDSSISKQTMVINMDDVVWNKIYSNNIKYHYPLNLSETENSILRSKIEGKISCPSPLQAKYLYAIYTKAQDKGIIK